MKRRYPKQENSTFLICEQARAELNKKISLIGWYGGDTIVFHPEPGKGPPYGLASLAFVIQFKDGEGRFSAGFSVSDPSGKVVSSATNLEAHVIEPGRGSLIIVQVAGPKFEALGDYTVHLKLENKVYDYHFKVDAAPKVA